MNDDELDNWLLEHNARLVAQTRTSVDLGARYEEILAGAHRTTPARRVSAPRVPAPTIAGLPQWLTTTVVVLCVVYGLAVSSLTDPWSSTPSDGTAPVLRQDRGGREPSVVVRQVSGPAGLSTVVPSGWEDAATATPGEVFEVRDPTANPPRFLRYGATLAGANPSAELTEYESMFAAERQNYERIRLAPTTFDGVTADVWEFLFDEYGGGQRHVYVLYWTVGLHRYFIYASAPASQWDDMVPIIDTMRARTEVTP